MVDFVTDPPVILPNGMVSITFSATDGVFNFSDAIVVLQSQYGAMTPDDIQDEEHRRWDDWYTIVNPPVEEDLING